MLKHGVKDAKTRASLGKQVELFKKHVQRLQQCAVDNEDKHLFKPCGVKKRPLKRLGITTSMPAIRSVIKIPESVGKVIDRELLRAKGVKKCEAIKLVEEGGFVDARNIDTKRKYGWADSILKLSAKEDPWTNVHTTSSIIEPESTANCVSLDVATQHFLECPDCSWWTTAGRRAFDVNGLDAKTRCANCRKVFLAKLWRCRCGIEWHQCHEHKLAPETMRKWKDSQKRPKARKRQRPTSEWIEAQVKPKRAKQKEETVELVCKNKDKRLLPIERLPPNLRRRLYPNSS